MTLIILAAGLSTNFIVFALLFRRLRQLSWQLRDMRAERNSEWILRALQGVPEEHKLAAPAADGTGLKPLPRPQPVRRKRHLGLYIGGLSGIAATVTETTRHAWREHRGQLVASVAAATVVAVTAVVLIVVERQAEPTKRPPSSAPLVTSTVTHTTTVTPAPASPTPTSGPMAGASPTARPSTSALPTAAGGVSGAPIVSGQATPSGTASSGGSTETSPPGDGTPPPSSSSPLPERPLPSAALCLGLAAMPVIDLTACLLGGG